MMDTAIAAVGFYLNVAVLTAAFYAAVKLLEDMWDDAQP